ncbi:MAG: aminotransferase class III-fold pyridoxal phosphate-dependent enzyme, partial [Alphaproteobacteria bacterium]|nr:aminotransferase class III-fold pyridoxal phosphate-dependent enzyme [Alphaproteobacteria bacterium]
PHVIDIRTIGLMGAVEMAPRAGAPGARAYEAFVHCFRAGQLVRQSGDALAFSPPLIISEAQIDELVAGVRAAIVALK